MSTERFRQSLLEPALIDTGSWLGCGGTSQRHFQQWEGLDPATLKKPRSTGKLCFNWYRINVTIPERIGEFTTRRADVAFEVTIDDYAEVWVDGKLPRAVGQAGGSVIKGFNTANRLIVAKNVVPGQHIELAVFGINGPLSAAPDNYIFMRTSPRLDFFRVPE